MYQSILEWIAKEGIVNEKGDALDFYNRPFLLDILTDWNPEIVVSACAQIGKSVSFSLKVLFAVKYLKMNCIYTMPTDADIQEFVSSKFNKIVQANNHEFVGMPTDNIERKELNDRFLFFKGTVSKSAPISTTADLLVHDEVSRSDQGAITTYKSRTKASKYKGRWLFSNPTTERDELDLVWQQSDQKEWMVTCRECKVEQYLTFPESINKETQTFQCKYCKFELSDDDRRLGHWKAQRESTISGYHISHLICPWISAKEILDDSEGDPAYFNNFVLGLPYSPGDLQVNKTTILDLWTPRNIETENYYIGIDVGNIKHYCLGSDKGIIKIGRFTKWEELDDMLRLYKPRAGVIDAMPDNTASKYYVEHYPFMQMSYFMENNNNPQTIVWWGENDKKGVVYSHRDRILDQMLSDMLEAKFLLGVPADQEFNRYIKHFETLRRTKVVNKKGIEKYIWDSTTGEDHFVFSTLYYYLAKIGNGNGIFLPQNEDKYEFIPNNNVVGDIGRLLKEKVRYTDD